MFWRWRYGGGVLEVALWWWRFGGGIMVWWRFDWLPKEMKLLSVIDDVLTRTYSGEEQKQLV